MGKLTQDELLKLGVFVGLVVLELIGDTTLAQIPIAGDLGNAGLDGVLNLAELYLGYSLATGK